MKKFLTIVVAAFMLLACDFKYPYGNELREGVTRVADFLYETTVYDYSPAPALRLMEDPALLAGACSAIRNGNCFGRNFDWYFDQSVEFIVRVPHAEGRYASVGIAGGIVNFTSAVVESAAESPYYDALPYITLDGINENGVCCCINIVPSDLPHTDNCCPGGDSLTMLMVPRYVLDRAASASEAVELLGKANIVSLKATDLEAHFMIADPEATYIVEWIDGRMTAVRDSFFVMTNFYQLREMTPHSMGLERYDLARQYYATAADEAGMIKLLHSLRQSRMYDRSVSPFWYSEYNGNWTEFGLPDLTIASEMADYEKVIRGDIRRYHQGKRDYKQDIWHTKHTAIYDLDSCSLRLFVQEDYAHPFEFKVEE
ncbi:MAG: linear amide C-N hydrolase [Bacteroidales bacterium]|nr:linear amide C-N hydrolase [Candidatus Colicola faecequi]